MPGQELHLLKTPSLAWRTDPRRAVLARTTIRLTEKVHIYQVGQRGEDHRWILLCLLSNPLELRWDGW